MFLNIILRQYSKEQFISSPRFFYKYLLRECEKLPKEAQNYYKHTVRQGFKQHVTESDPERINKIVTKTIEDAKWIVNKYSKSPVP